MRPSLSAYNVPDVAASDPELFGDFPLPNACLPEIPYLEHGGFCQFSVPVLRTRMPHFLRLLLEESAFLGEHVRDVLKLSAEKEMGWIDA